MSNLNISISCITQKFVVQLNCGARHRYQPGKSVSCDVYKESKEVANGGLHA